MTNVQYTVSGTPYEVASGKFVPNGAAMGIRINAFLLGVVAGIVIAVAVIVLVPKTNTPTGPAGSAPGVGPTITDRRPGDAFDPEISDPTPGEPRQSEPDDEVVMPEEGD